MAHYVLLDENNVVVRVFAGRDEWEVVDGISDWEEYYGNRTGQRCLRTSYNHKIRKQYAGLGYTYNEEKDIFIAFQPFPSWSLDENDDWQPPIPMPEDGKAYIWDEETLSWKEYVNDPAS